MTVFSKNPILAAPYVALLSIPVVMTMTTKLAWEKKGLFGLYISSQSGQELKAGAKAGTEAEASERCCLLACSFCLSPGPRALDVAPPTIGGGHLFPAAQTTK